MASTKASDVLQNYHKFLNVVIQMAPDSYDAKFYHNIKLVEIYTAKSGERHFVNDT